jgi:hypothetical protein
MTYGTEAQSSDVEAFALTVASGKSRFGDAHDARANALEALHGKDWRRAHQEIRRLLWEARISGQLNAELEARDLMGDLYEAVGEGASAIGNFIRAGSADKSGRLAKTLDQRLTVEPEIQGKAPWLVAAALAVLDADGDQRPQEDADALAGLALERIHGMPQSPFGPQVWVTAFKALAGLAPAVSQELANGILSIVEPLIERAPNTHRLVDSQLIAILEALHLAHVELRPRIAALLVRALRYPGVAEPASDWLVSNVGQDPQLAALVKAEAEGGLDRATVVLALAGQPDDQAIELSIRRIQDFLSKELVAGDQFGLNPGLELVGVFAQAVDQPMREAAANRLWAHAANAADIELNRAAALLGLGHLAEDLPEGKRRELFKLALTLTDPHLPLGKLDEMFRQSQHPLSAARINLGQGQLRRGALLLAARSATTLEDAGRLRGELRLLIMSADDADKSTCARILLAIEPLAGIVVDIEDIAASRSPSLRSAAAWLITRGKAIAPDAARSLARDPERSVRLTVAYGLKPLIESDQKLASELIALMESDKSATVRNVVRGRSA